jgi:hypothetical protein
MSKPGGQTTQIALSARGLERAAPVGQTDFTIVTGAAQFHCTKFQAAFISPVIADLLTTDPTIERFNIEGVRLESSSQSILGDLLHTGSCDMCESASDLDAELFKLCSSLRNSELVQQVFEIRYQKEEMNLSNCIDRIQGKLSLQLKWSEELEFIASHFYELDRSSFVDFSIETIEEILMQEWLQISSEDSLLEYLISLGSKGKALLCHVRYDNLSAEGVCRFLSNITYSDIDSRLWDSICYRLRHPIVLEPNDWLRSRVGKRFESTTPWSGILAHLTSVCGGNVHEKGVVTITSSSDAYNKCYQVANHGWGNFWYSGNFPNSWIQFDFKESKILMSEYTLKAHGRSNDQYHFREWKIEGLNDLSEWEMLDERNTNEMIPAWATKTFKCSSSNASRFYRFIRMTQTGKNSGGTRDYLMLCNIEFFGLLQSRQSS